VSFRTLGHWTSQAHSRFNAFLTSWEP